MVKSVDQLNFLLVIIACIVAHIVPVEALVVSYAFLGPAHYLTEISWLHDRQYFTTQKYDYVILLPLAVVLPLLYDPHNILLMITFFLAICMAFTANWQYRLGVSLFVTAAFIILNSATSSIYFFLMLPTLVHVFVFTLLFVLLGALRNNSAYGYLTIGMMVIAGMSFFVDIPLPLLHTQYGMDNITYIQGIYQSFFELIDVDYQQAATQKIIGFVGFAYTYHYLNWFSKTNIIGWNQISSTRLAVIALLYIGSIALYLYDYALGFKALLILSVMHVILEFPLNGLSVMQIGKILKAKLVARSV